MITSAPPAAAGRLGGAAYLYRELWRIIQGRRGTFVSAVALLVAAQLIVLAVPYASGRAIDALQLDARTGLLEAGRWLLLMLALSAGAWLLHGPGRILERSVALAVRQRLSAMLIERPACWSSDCSPCSSRSSARSRSTRRNGARSISQRAS